MRKQRIALIPYYQSKDEVMLNDFVDLINAEHGLRPNFFTSSFARLPFFSTTDLHPPLATTGFLHFIFLSLHPPLATTRFLQFLFWSHPLQRRRRHRRPNRLHDDIEDIATQQIQQFRSFTSISRRPNRFRNFTAATDFTATSTTASTSATSTASSDSPLHPPVQIFEGHSHYVMQVTINPKDTNTFASASLDRTIKGTRLGPD
ncbi:hypothetical protein LXL04_011085 [Taraxacum kok-saghyz]